MHGRSYLQWVCINCAYVGAWHLLHSRLAQFSLERCEKVVVLQSFIRLSRVHNSSVLRITTCRMCCLL